jgi:aspartyl aminopeptidase
VNETLKFNQETEFVPILGQLEKQLNSDLLNNDEEESSSEFVEVRVPESNVARDASSIQKNHHPGLLSLLAKELSVSAEDIHDFELFVYITNSRTTKC